MAREENKTDRVILGIDPGTNVMGYGIVHIKGLTIKLVELDIIHLRNVPSHADKLKSIFRTVTELIEKHLPDEVALEAPFYAKNIQSMLKLGRAQGVAMAAALHRNLPVFEYSPRKIKQSITGRGSATKEQVALMLQKILSVPALPGKLDATDALGVAVCHFFQNDISRRGNLHGRPNSSKKGYGSWKAFAGDNPGRIVQ